MGQFPMRERPVPFELRLYALSTNYANGLGIGKVELEEVSPHLRGERESGNQFRKNYFQFTRLRFEPRSPRPQQSSSTRLAPMSTERTPLRLTEPGPNYVFMTNSGRVYRRKVHQFQCCICATVLSLFVMALIISVSYYVNHDPDDEGNSTAPPLNVTTDVTETPNLLQLVSWPIPEKPAPDWSGDYVDPSQLETAVGAGKAALMARDMLETRTPTLSFLSPSYRHQKTVRTNARADQLARAGYVMDVATRTLVNSADINSPKTSTSGHADKAPVSSYLVCRKLRDRGSNLGHLYNTFERPPTHQCSGKALTGGSVGKGPAFDADWMSKEACADGPQPPFACNPTPYRTADGTCNNLNHPYKWGVALRPFRRVIQPDYADGVSAPRVSSDGGALPSARKVSVTVHRPLYQDDPDFTVMLAVWGQFMDHDITATALSQAVGGKSISCCKVFTSNSSVDKHPECFPVPLADGDPFYNQWNISCMEFVRSAPAPLCHFGPREQLNQASSFLDGSVVYGPYDSVVNKLRSFQGGQLRMYTTVDGRTLLPTSTDPTDGCNQQEEALKGRYCFESGTVLTDVTLMT
uniref:(California timema) hypothetical protein n=1 Tax=Timema californicum TaxID=61474 RepID=A0A7R9IW96_TIMCA|nr:unnamed protein product [Timema californicum]